MRFRAALFVLCIGVSSGYGCANEQVAPSTYLDEPSTCTSLDEMLPITFGLIEGGELSELKKALSEEMDESDQRVLIHLVSGILKVFPPSRFPELGAVAQSSLMPDLLDLLHDLQVSADALAPELQAPYDVGVHRFTQTCSLEVALRVVDGAIDHADVILEVLDAFLGESGDLLNTSAMEPQAWFDLYVGFLEIGAALPGSDGELKELISALAALTGLEVLEALSPLFDDPVLVSNLGQTLHCLYTLETGYGSGVLWGLAHISAGNAAERKERPAPAVDPGGTQEVSGENAGIESSTISAIQEMVGGMLASPELLESLRIALDWLFYPDRAARIRADFARLLGSGAIEELLVTASMLDDSDCVRSDPNDSGSPRAVTR